MRGLKKILSSSLALFIVLSNIAPAFASDINQQILEETYIQIPEELKEETQEKARNPGDENQSIEENQVIPTEEENPKEEENLDAKSEEILKPEQVAKEEKVSFKLKLKLIGFIGREFDFDEVFPNGAKLDFIYLDKRTKEEKTMTQSLRADQDQIDFGSLYLEEIQSGKLELNKETDGSDMALIDERMDFSKYNPNLDFVYKIYQIPNSKVEFKTFDKNGNLIANPNFGKFTYRIENLIRDNQDLANHSTRSLIKPSEIDFKLWEDKYENLSLPSISLEESQNGYIENGDFAYKICGQGHIDDDLTKPFEVRLIQKSKLIQATDRPTYTDPETAREIVDLDYENQGQYWTLRGLKVQVPEEKTDLEEIDQASDHSEEKTEETEKNIDQIMDLRSQALEKQDRNSQAKLPDLENLLNKKEEEKQEGDKEKEEVKEDKEESQEADKNPADPTENPAEEKPEADLEISPQPEENRQMAGGDSREPVYNENDVVLEVLFYGLKNKEFKFNKIFNSENPPIVIFDYFDEDTFEDTVIEKPFSPTENRINFGTFEQIDVRNISFYLKNKDAREKILVNTTNGIGGQSGTSTFNLHLYEIQNREVIFKTQDQNGNEIDANPAGKFTYSLYNTQKQGDIPTNSSPQEMINSREVNIINWKYNYDGTYAPSVELKNAQNGFIVDRDYAYKILKQEQENDDKSNPLEVTLIRKQKVIVGGDHPKTTDPTTGSEIYDPDYVKVEFKAGNHSKITGNNPVYWVLKDVDLGNAIKAPDLAVDDGYVFAYWLPYLKENQKYSSDTVHVSEIKKRLEFDYLTYSGDTTFEGIKVRDPIVKGINHPIEYVAFVKAYGQYGQEYFKSTIDVDKAGEVRLSMWGNQIIDHPGVDTVWADFSISASKELGNDILASPDKKLTRKAYLLISDTVGNTNWAGLNITIKTQNTKGNVAPEEVSTSQNVSLSKDQIIEAVKKGEFTYNFDVPKQNKMTEGPLKNALHKVVDGKNVLNPDKVKSFEITDEDYNNIDFGQIGQQEVPVTITYLDNSTSIVKVKINISPNIPTGLRDTGYFMPILLLSFGLMASLISLVIFRKKILNYDE